MFIRLVETALSSNTCSEYDGLCSAVHSSYDVEIDLL